MTDMSKLLGEAWKEIPVDDKKVMRRDHENAMRRRRSGKKEVKEALSRLKVDHIASFSPSHFYS